MKMSALRRTVFAVAAFAGMAALATSPALAQAPPGPPVCGSVASLMNLEIWGEGLAALGDNIVSIPAVSPINNNPSSANNGFRQICDRFGLGTGSSAALQFNGQTGQVVTYLCSQPAPPGWQPGQATLVRPTTIPAGASTTGRIPGVECSQPYTSYGEGVGAVGDNMYSVPNTITSSSPEDLCNQLNLPPSSAVLDFVAGPTSNVRTHLCTQTPTFSLRLGNGVLIRPTGAPGTAVATGQAIIF
jgi:hypothetical protein